jgi:hypothetical protein
MKKADLEGTKPGHRARVTLLAGDELLPEIDRLFRRFGKYLRVRAAVFKGRCQGKCMIGHVRDEKSP